MAVLTNEGDGTFGQPVIYDSGSIAFGVVVADLNNDARLDLGLAGFNDVRVLMGNVAGTFGPFANYVSGSAPVAIAAADA